MSSGVESNRVALTLIQTVRLTCSLSRFQSSCPRPLRNFYIYYVASHDGGIIDIFFLNAQVSFEKQRQHQQRAGLAYQRQAACGCRQQKGRGCRRMGEAATERLWRRLGFWFKDRSVACASLSSAWHSLLICCACCRYGRFLGARLHSSMPWS